jgi:protein disulfide-isomerase
MYGKVVFALLALASIPVFARPPEAGAVHWQSLEQAEAAESDRPLLVYFGAEWCGPCRMLETTVFNQPEIQAALAPFRAVYIDGDAPDALESMERFNVKVFPSLVAIAPDGKETGRMTGSAEKRDFLAFLATATLAEGPAAMLARIDAGENLTAQQWKLLSQIDVQFVALVQENDETGQADLHLLQGRLAKAVEMIEGRDQPLDAVTDAWIRLKSLIVDSVSSKPAGSIAAHRALLDKVLDDASLRTALEGPLLGFSEEILAYLEPTAGGSKRNLAHRLLDAMEGAYARAEASLPWKMEILQLTLPLLEFGSDRIDADKARLAERAEEALKQAADPRSRLAVIGSVAHVLRRTGREFRAEAAVRETLSIAPESYWLNASLAGYAKQRGDAEAAVTLAERAYRASLSHKDALAYGPSWIEALIDRDPKQVGTIAAAADEVLQGASASKDVFRGWHADYWPQFAATLGTWGAADKPARSATLAGFARLFDALCTRVKNDAAASKACQAAKNALAAPPVAAG